MTGACHFPTSASSTYVFPLSHFGHKGFCHIQAGRLNFAVAAVAATVSWALSAMEGPKVGNDMGRGDRSGSVGALTMTGKKRRERHQCLNDDENTLWWVEVKEKHRRLKATCSHSLYMLAHLVLAQRFT